MADKTDFKSKLEELETINEWFQSDDIDLDEGLKKLKRAKELIKYCKSRLKDVENEFNTIKEEMQDDNYSAESDDTSEKTLFSAYSVVEKTTTQTSLLDEE
jgi:exodeoxyribonuclease VII small subunit